MMRLVLRGVSTVVWFFGAVGWSLPLAVAGERGASPHLSRPPDIPTERLERPRPEQDRLGKGQVQTALRQAEVTALANAAVKKELGTSFDEYELKTVVFDPPTNTWFVTFEPRPSHSPPRSCVIVLVRDDAGGTDVRPCS